LFDLYADSGAFARYAQYGRYLIGLVKPDAVISVDDRVVVMARRHTQKKKGTIKVVSLGEDEVQAQRDLLQRLKSRDDADISAVKQGIRRASRERMYLESLDESYRLKDLGALPEPWESAFTDDGEEFFIKYIISFGCV
jgi:hypothetical protein